MFEKLQPAPADPILGLTEAFLADPNPQKINLGVGVYKDAQGKTPVLECVKEAERRLLETETNKAYKPIDGDPAYRSMVQSLLFGDGHEVVQTKRAATAHTPSGTGALRVAGDYLKQNHPGTTIWLSEPTWANHPKVFDAAGVPTKTYRYANANVTGLDFAAMTEDLANVPAGDVVLLHGCCHNPTGIDPSNQQWAEIAELLAERGVVPLLDFAYQGLGDGITEDAAGLMALAGKCREMLICTSFSKNMSLYNERVGSFTVVADTPDAAAAALSHVKVSIRTNYSNPPAHGGSIVTTILGDADLTAQWHEELAQMRNRINGMRQAFADRMAATGVDRDFSYITAQRGMFSYSGLTKDQVARLKNDHAIYIVGSGRINVAGMTESNLDRLCDAIASVL
jgi:aspartate/tyrosine/aromatic aminotransferase